MAPDGPMAGLLHGTGLGLAARLAQQLLRALVLADVRGVVAEEEPAVRATRRRGRAPGAGGGKKWGVNLQMVVEMTQKTGGSRI